uniref:diacylglycerol kinase (ATP) n=1 Tax=Timema bartmani TaxID=61472 RepID=A0A7R9HZV1_9NEOP|nr:unnamed protein product [Timema bartmani]
MKYTSVLSFVVLTDSSQLTSDGFEKLPDQIIARPLPQDRGLSLLQHRRHSRQGLLLGGYVPPTSISEMQKPDGSIISCWEESAKLLIATLLLDNDSKKKTEEHRGIEQQNPVAHCWSEPIHHKRKFCNVCRKRLEDSLSIHCEICEYFVHADCQDFAVADCKENATYLPGKDLATLHHQHHWREGNLPSNTKCAMCKKTCWSVECLSGMRCEWCGMTSHAICYRQVPGDCTFGNLEPIYLPPHAVSIPRTEVPMEAIIGVQVRRKETMSLTIKFSSYLVNVSFSHIRWTEKTIMKDPTT